MKSKDQKIGKIVKGWIKDAGRSQSSVAEELGISQQNFNLQLRGNRPIPNERINKLVEWFNPSEGDFKKIKSLIAENATCGLNLPKGTNAPADLTENANAPGNAKLVILKRNAKIAQLRLEVFYLNRKIKKLEHAGLATSAPCKKDGCNDLKINNNKTADVAPKQGV